MCNKISFQDLKAVNALNISRSILRMFGWIVGFFYICLYGSEVTERYQSVAHAIYNCHLHGDLPYNIIKYFPVLIAFTQRPIYFYGCFNVRCILATFRQVGFDLRNQ